MYQEFEPEKAFKEIDADKDNTIDAQDIIKFMKKQFIRFSKSDAEMIIKEFDSDQDQTLSLDEFCCFLLPSTNGALRRLCQMRKNSYSYNPNKPLDSVSSDMIARHFERELRFLKKRD